MSISDTYALLSKITIEIWIPQDEDRKEASELLDNLDIEGEIDSFVQGILPADYYIRTLS